MQWIERGIEALSPKWAAERAYFRATLQMARAYDAAATGRRHDGWHTTGSSANAEIGPAASRMRNRGRDLVRNNGHAMTAKRKLPAHMVGTGIVPRLAVRDDRAARSRFKDDWQAFIDNSDPEGMTDFYGQLQLAAGTVVESGEALLRFLPRPASWNMRVPLQVQVLEPDYVDFGKTMPLQGGGVIIQGVEYDADGRRVAYWLFDEHPGESLAIARKGGLDSRRVPATLVRPVFERLRPGQVHGVTWFAPVAVKMRDVGDYDDAEIMRKKIAACFAAFVKRSGQARSTLAAKPDTDSKGRRIERMSPAMIQYLAQDEDVTFASPPGAEGYAEFMELQLHAIAAGIGMTYEQLTGDLSGVNFSSIREGKLDFWQLLDTWQWQMLIPQACRPTMHLVQQLRVALGYAPPAQLPAPIVWTPPVRPWVDPWKDSQARKNDVRSGFASLRGVIAERGEDPDDFFDELAETFEQLDALGIVLDSDPRKTSNAGLTQARPPGSELPAPVPGEEDSAEGESNADV